MLLTVTTLKDRLENVQRFVAGNLSGGVDHLVIFLEDSAPEVHDYLRQHEHVTYFDSDGDWFAKHRPQLLNRRQNINSNAVRAVLREAGSTDWLFHIDGDEILRVDRAALAALSPKVQAVRAAPQEAVGVLDQVETPRLYKRLLDQDELSLLHTLGHLSEPTNSLYFRSHIAGKIGVRAQADVHLRMHSVILPSGRRGPAHEDPAFAMLHLESWSGSEFVRKWQAMVDSGPAINFGTHRQIIADGLRALLQGDIDPTTRARLLGEIYQRHMADPVETLQELGYLREHDVLAGPHRPAPDAAVLAELRTRLDALKGTKRGHFAPPPIPDPDERARARAAEQEHEEAVARGASPADPATAGGLRKGLRRAGRRLGL